MIKYNNFCNQNVFQCPKNGEQDFQKWSAIVTLQNNNINNNNKNSNKKKGYTIQDIPKNSLSYTKWHWVIMQQNWPE